MVHDNAQRLGLEAVQERLVRRLVRLPPHHHALHQLGQRRHQGHHRLLARLHHEAGPVIRLPRNKRLFTHELIRMLPRGSLS